MMVAGWRVACAFRPAGRVIDDGSGGRTVPSGASCLLAYIVFGRRRWKGSVGRAFVEGRDQFGIRTCRVCRPVMMGVTSNSPASGSVPREVPSVDGGRVRIVGSESVRRAAEALRVWAGECCRGRQSWIQHGSARRESGSNRGERSLEPGRQASEQLPASVFVASAVVVTGCRKYGYVHTARSRRIAHREHTCFAYRRSRQRQRWVWEVNACLAPCRCCIPARTKRRGSGP